MKRDKAVNGVVRGLGRVEKGVGGGEAWGRGGESKEVSVRRGEVEEAAGCEGKRKKR